MPPPWFSTVTLPFNYWYRQNPAARRAVDSQGNVTIVNDQAAPKSLLLRIPLDAAEVPAGPHERVPPLESLPEARRRLVEQVEEKFEARPIWSRRALANALQSAEWAAWGKQLVAHVGYEFRSGPWRDLTVKFGVDPRTDPPCRVYQSMIFQFDAEARARHVGVTPRKGGKKVMHVDDGPRRRATAESHVFDGVEVGLDGKIWQVCDVTYPVVRDLLATTNLRKTCHVSSLRQDYGIMRFKGITDVTRVSASRMGGTTTARGPRPS